MIANVELDEKDENDYICEDKFTFISYGDKFF